MTNRAALKAFLPTKGQKYIKPEKAGEAAEYMARIKRDGQAARLAFAAIAEQFCRRNPSFQLDRVSHWSSQAQLCRPHFWVYFAEKIERASPMFALRVYGDEEQLGISVEVSIIERKRDEQSLEKQARILECPADLETYYQYQQGDMTYRLSGTDENRLWLKEQVYAGQIRKVLVKKDVPWLSGQSDSALLEQLTYATIRLQPFFQETQKIIHNA